jgi:hypothetical protein
VQHKPHRDGEQQTAEAAPVDEREEREHPGAHTDRADEIHRPAPDPVRQRAPCRDHREVHGGGNEYGIERGLLAELHRGRGVDEDERRDDVVADVLGHPRAHRHQHIAPVVPQHGDQRHLLDLPGGRLALLGLCQRRLEDRRFIDRETYPQTDDHKHTGEEERYAPAP